MSVSPRGLLLVVLVGCGGGPRLHTATHPTPTVETPGAARASVTVSLRADAVAYRLVATGGRVCATDPLGEVRCADPASPTEWHHSVDALAGMPLRDGYVVTSERLTMRADRAVSLERHIEAGAGAFIEVLGDDRAIAVTSEPLPEIAPGVRGRSTRPLVATYAASLAQAFGPARGTLLVDPGTAASNDWALIVDEEPTSAPTLGDDEIRAWMTAAWTGAQGWQRGAAQYLAWLIDVREGRLTAEGLLDAWLRAYLTYRHTMDGRPLDESTLARRLAGGAVVALCADAMLRARGEDLLVATRRGTFPPAVSEEMSERAAFRGVMDVDPCLEKLGLRLAVSRFEDPGAAALLRVGAVADEPPRITTGRSFFEPGDRLVSVADVAVRRLEDVAWALRDVEVGDRFVIVVERDGQTRRTWARRPRTSGDERTRYFLAPTESPGAVSLH